MSLLVPARTALPRVFLAGVIIQEGNDAKSFVDLGNGNDTLIGEAAGVVFAKGGVAGIALLDELAPGVQPAAIYSGNGNDLVIGEAHVSTIEPSDDIPLGTVEHGVYGISALGAPLPTIPGTAGAIYMGNGNDEVIGRASIDGVMVDGFGDEILIDMGSGNDRLEGFGEFVGVGGSGRDVWDLSGYCRKDFRITPGSQGSQSAEFHIIRPPGSSLPEATAFIGEFEIFIFNDGVFQFSDLFA